MKLDDLCIGGYNGSQQSAAGKILRRVLIERKQGRETSN
jgi:hypothetical protein